MSSKLESDVCRRLQVALSSESYEGNLQQAWQKSNRNLLPGLWRDSLHVTCGLTACTPGSAPVTSMGKLYLLPFLHCQQIMQKSYVWIFVKFE